MEKNFLGFIFSALIVGCGETNEVKLIELGNLNEMQLVEEYTNVDLITSYKAPKCEDEKIYSNVYVCALQSADTLYVLEFCQEMSFFAKNDYEEKSDLHLVIDKKDILKAYVGRVYIPEQADIPKNGKFVIGTITRLQY